MTDCQICKKEDDVRNAKPSFFVPFFLYLYTARRSFEYYRQVYFVHSGLQDESLQLSCTGDIQLTSRSEGSEKESQKEVSINPDDYNHGFPQKRRQ